MMVTYEHAFDANEWFIVISLILIGIIIAIAPKIFSFLEGVAHYIYGAFIAMFFDHVIGVPAWDLYDINDSSAYEIFDFLTYLIYGYYSYFYAYLYNKLRIKRYMHIPYLFIWTCFSVLIEWLGIKIGLFHFNKGYEMYWSVPIYLLVQSLHIIYYHLIRVSEKKQSIRQLSGGK